MEAFGFFGVNNYGYACNVPWSPFCFMQQQIQPTLRVSVLPPETSKQLSFKKNETRYNVVALNIDAGTDCGGSIEDGKAIEKPPATDVELYLECLSRLIEEAEKETNRVKIKARVCYFLGKNVEESIEEANESFNEGIEIFNSVINCNERMNNRLNSDEKNAVELAVERLREAIVSRLKI